MSRMLFAALALALSIAPPVALGARQTILVYGDSLSAAYGIAQAEGWVALLEQRIRREKLDYNVVNASISGETTSGGASRIAATLARHRPAIVIVELGANDGLRGLPVEQMKANLSAIVESSRKAGAQVVVVGMRLPPNYGPDYTRAFDAAFAEVARRHRAGLVPFLFEGIADAADYFQPDRLHPNEKAQPRLLANVWSVLGPRLRRAPK